VALVPKKAPSSVPNTSLARRSNSATRSRTLGPIYQRNGGSDQPSPRRLLDSLLEESGFEPLVPLATEMLIELARGITNATRGLAIGDNSLGLGLFFAITSCRIKPSIPCSDCAQQRHKIIRNGVALVGRRA
jgi:hypothetical protein